MLVYLVNMYVILASIELQSLHKKLSRTLESAQGPLLSSRACTVYKGPYWAPEYV